jgi:hypothetical protein
MKLKEFLDGLNQLVKDYPACLNLDVITAKDAEGNGFEIVHYGPSVGVFEDDEFCPKDSDYFEEEYGYTDTDVNAICIN